jgi:hypothetical protein
MTSLKTDREVTSPIIFTNGTTTSPEYYLKYTTKTDTFKFIEGKAKEKKA